MAPCATGALAMSAAPSNQKTLSTSAAVLASSGLNQPAPQIALDALILQNALNAQRTTLGESVVKAKSKIADPDVRRTFILFGDPAMQVKQAPAASKTN